MSRGWWEDVETKGVDLFLRGNGRWDFPVVGEAAYQAALEHVTSGKKVDGCEIDCVAVLVHQDDNPYDDKAVAVGIGGFLVGFLSRRDARSFRKAMKEYGTEPVACRALIRGGWDRGGRDTGYFGVNLDIKWPLQVRRKRDNSK